MVIRDKRSNNCMASCKLKSIFFFSIQKIKAKIEIKTQTILHLGTPEVVDATTWKRPIDFRDGNTTDIIGGKVDKLGLRC